MTDECRENPRKLAAGECCCSVGDSDGDGVEDCMDRSVDLLRFDWPQQIQIYDGTVRSRLVARVGDVAAVSVRPCARPRACAA